MDVLEEAFTATRRHNPTFGVEDQAREGERMLMDKSPGQHFNEFEGSCILSSLSRP